MFLICIIQFLNLSIHYVISFILNVLNLSGKFLLLPFFKLGIMLVVVFTLIIMYPRAYNFKTILLTRRNYKKNKNKFSKANSKIIHLSNDYKHYLMWEKLLSIFEWFTITGCCNLFGFSYTQAPLTVIGECMLPITVVCFILMIVSYNIVRYFDKHKKFTDFKNYLRYQKWCEYLQYVKGCRKESKVNPRRINFK